jgi:hypothetical protein
MNIGRGQQLSGPGSPRPGSLLPGVAGVLQLNAFNNGLRNAAI